MLDIADKELACITLFTLEIRITLHAILWGIGTPVAWSFVIGWIRALWALKSREYNEVRKLFFFGWVQNIWLASGWPYNEEKQYLRPFVIIIFFPSNVLWAATTPAPSDSFWLAFLQMSVLVMMANLYLTFFAVIWAERILSKLRVKTVFHLFTKNRFRRLHPAEELIPIIDELLSTKKFRFSYRLARADDSLGGFWGTTELLGGLRRTKLATIWELERYRLALKWAIERHPTMGIIPDEEIARYKQVINSFENALEGARARLIDMQTHDAIINDIDLSSKQMKIAFWSAIGSIASALAAFTAALITFIGQ
jgi:hypothetical protein